MHGCSHSLFPSLNPLNFCILPGKQKFDCFPPSFGLVLCLPMRPLTIQLPPHESWVNLQGLPSPGSWAVSGACHFLILCSQPFSLFLFFYSSLAGKGRGVLYKSSHQCLSLLTLHTTIVVTLLSPTACFLCGGEPDQTVFCHMYYSRLLGLKAQKTHPLAKEKDMSLQAVYDILQEVF